MRIKRVYEPPAPDDGFRVLVDRLWPRGLSKERAAIDLWEKDVAPSDALRTAFHHGGLPWPDFADHYRAELAGAPPRAEQPRPRAGRPAPARRRSTSCVAPSRTTRRQPSCTPPMTSSTIRPSSCSTSSRTPREHPLRGSGRSRPGPRALHEALPVDDCPFDWSLPTRIVDVDGRVLAHVATAARSASPTAGLTSPSPR